MRRGYRVESSITLGSRYIITRRGRWEAGGESGEGAAKGGHIRGGDGAGKL